MSAKDLHIVYDANSDKVFVVDGYGRKVDATAEFHQAVILWINEGELPGPGKEKDKKIMHNKNAAYEISCKRLK